MGTSIVANPIAQLDKIGTPVKKLTRAQQGIARRVAKFEAQRAQEVPVAGMVMQDLNPGVEHQRKATFTPKKAVAQQPLSVQRPLAAAPQQIVQRVSRALEPAPVAAADGFDELDAEFGGDGEGATAPEAGTEPDTDTSEILKRFKGTPDEVAKQLAKSYAASEKRMRQLEAERQMLIKGQAAPVAAAPVTPQTNQVQVQPTFNYKRFKDDILDHGDTVAQEFEQHLTGTLDQKMAQVIAPLYEEAIDNRLFRKYGDVVTEDNLDLIKAMAQNAVGNNRWEKLVNAVSNYKTSMPGITSHELPEVQAMQKSAQAPNPQGKIAGEKKMYKQSYLKDLIDAKVKTGEYSRDPKWRRLVESAYEQGRVLRGQ